MSLFSVAGKNVLVTGGSRGIGYMIAQGYVEAGANVVLTSRDEKACRKAADELKCRYLVSNVSSRAGCEALASDVAAAFDSKLHVLINNAGTSWGEPLERESKTNWGFDKVLDLNVKGIFYLTRACLPLMESAATEEDPARVVNVGSVAGFVPQQAPTHAYDISKAAVHHLTRKLAADLAPRHVTVNCVAPGFVPTRMSQGLASWGANEQALASLTPLGRLGRKDDMAGACIYLTSRAGAWCTGVVLPVDGGCIGAAQIPLMSSDL
jgi:NAD(P)-dependent dehydrogenase (short-subunit alcohol dehydrogenase family)